MKTAITVIAIILIAIAFLTLVHSGNSVIFNNGVCEICGGNYEFKTCGGGRIKDYIYECDSCGHLIEITQLINKNAD